MSAVNGMTLWLDGADRSVLLDDAACAGNATTTAIGCWLDKSGQVPANNFVQATAANQPDVAKWNGLTAANFTDTSDVLDSVDGKASYQTVFVAADVSSSAKVIDLFGHSGKDFNVRIGSKVSRSKPDENDWSFDPAGALNWANGAELVNADGPVLIITTDQARSATSLPASVSNAFDGWGMVGQVGMLSPSTTFHHGRAPFGGGIPGPKMGRADHAAGADGGHRGGLGPERRHRLLDGARVRRRRRRHQVLRDVHARR